VRTRVTVGMQSVAVPFTWTGKELEAKVPPRSGSGPWVLRVEVADTSGRQLAREFVEVIRGPHESASEERRVVRRAVGRR
jgi:hypothetical protein